MKTQAIAADSTAEIDLGNSPGMSISAKDGIATVYVDYYNPKTGNYTSAIKASAGYLSPFQVHPGTSKDILKSDLESEHIRVGTKDASITVTY